MSRNSAGTYTAPASSVNPAVEGTTIDEADFNALVDDLETALTDSLSVSGKGKVTAHIDFDENASPGTPDANVGRLYTADIGGTTSLMYKDASGTVSNLLLNAPALSFSFSTSTTTTSDPGSGVVRFNNATLASVTEIAVDDNDASGTDVSTEVLSWDDTGTTNRGRLLVQKRSASGVVRVIFTVSGASTDESGWTRLAVTYVSHVGTFAASDPLAITFLPPGPTGPMGSGDVTGPAASVDSEIALFSSTTGKVIKRASTTGILKGTSGVISAASAGTDYYNPGGTDVAVADGGTGVSSLTAYAVMCGGTTGTGAVQSIASVGTSGQVLTSNGAGALPTFQAAAAGGHITNPQGRLTLTSATPVLTSTVSGATTIYYTQYSGQYCPIYSGSAWAMSDVGGELSQTTTDTTKSPAACTTNSNYDLFVWNDSGTYRCTRGPAWTSDTARGTGVGTTELQRISGIWTNKNAITNGPAANRGTYVGTVRTNGSSQIDYIFGGTAAGGTEAKHYVWNMYNRVSVAGMVGNSTASWTYAVNAWRAANAATTYRMNLVIGLAESAVSVDYQATVAGAPGIANAEIAIGLDSSTTAAGSYGFTQNAYAPMPAIYREITTLGYHYFQALEKASSGATITVYGGSAQVYQAGLLYSFYA